MTFSRRLRRAFRRAPLIGLARVRRACMLPKNRMLEVEAGCHMLIRLGLLQEYTFLRQSLLLTWKWHPHNVMLNGVADQTILKYTDRMQAKWQWSIRKILRAARVYDKNVFNVLSRSYGFPLDYKF